MFGGGFSGITISKHVIWNGRIFLHRRHEYGDGEVWNEWKFMDRSETLEDDGLERRSRNWGIREGVAPANCYGRKDSRCGLHTRVTDNLVEAYVLEKAGDAKSLSVWDCDDKASEPGRGSAGGG